MMSLGRTAIGVGLGAVGVGILGLSASGEFAEASRDLYLDAGIWIFWGTLDSLEAGILLGDSRELGVVSWGFWDFFDETEASEFCELFDR